MQLSFPPYSEDQEIIDGRQVHSSSWLPPYSTHQLSSHTLNVPYSEMKPPTPVFMGTTPLQEQRPTQQHYQRPQWLSMCPGSRPPTHAVTSQPHYGTMVSNAHVAAIGPNSHLQSAATHYPAQLQVGGTSQYQRGKHCLFVRDYTIFFLTKYYIIPPAVNQHVGGPLATPEAHSQYFPTSITTTGDAYHASSAQFPGILMNVTMLATLLCWPVCYKGFIWKRDPM